MVSWDDWRHQGKNLSKDSSINEYSWVLQPLAKVVPAQPIHQNSLFEIIEKVLPDSPEGVIWMVVYDLKVLMQFLGAYMFHMQFLAWLFWCVIDHFGLNMHRPTLWGLSEKFGGSLGHRLGMQIGQFGSKSRRKSSSFFRQCNGLMTMMKSMMREKLGE